MGDFISREAALDAQNKSMNLAECRKRLERLPAADVVKARHGHWIPTHDNDKKRCSCCDVIHLIAQYPHGEINYCPNCGAIMNGGKNA